MTDKKGTGGELGRIKITENMQWIIRDDGDPDWYTKIEEEVNGTVINDYVFKSKIRKNLGDEEFMEKLDDVGQDNYVSLL